MIETNYKVTVGDDLVKNDVIRDLYIDEKIYKAELTVKKFTGEIFSTKCYIKPVDLDSIKAIAEIIDIEKAYKMFIDSDGKVIFHTNDMGEILNG